jgi:putative peptidoglycan lipid II flippase
MADREPGGKTEKGQTAIGGVFSVFSINVLTRIVSYARHILITAYIGLTGGLDAFFAALSAVGIFVLVFGDIFDSIGIPRLVKARIEGGEAEFRRTAGTVVRVAILISIGCTALLFVLAPVTPWIAPGFSEAQKSTVVRFVYYLIPMAIVYLPYHAMGSVLRSLRQFKAFYVAELLASVATVGILATWHTTVSAVPVAWSAGYIAGAVYLFLRTRKWVSWRVEGGSGEKKVFWDFVRLLPIYLVSQLYTVVDKTFGSYLPAGSVSALYYGLLLATTIPSLLAVENIFVTPLAESEEKEQVLARILSGIVLVFVPVVFFFFRNSREIVSILFERGMFRDVSVEMTASALQYYVCALPALAFWGLLVRFHQVQERFGDLFLVSLAGLFFHAILNYLFGFYLGMGLRGLALGTVVAAYLLVIGGLRLPVKFGAGIPFRKAGRLGFLVTIFSALAIGASELVPWSMGTFVTLSVRASLFAVIYLAAVFRFPDRELRSITDEIVWNFRNTIYPGKWRAER